MFDKLFSYKPMKDFARYVETWNRESQVLAAKAAGTDPDLATTGTKTVCINGQPIVLPACATIDLSNAAVAPNLAGTTIATTYEQYWVVVAKADGTCLVLKGSEATLTATGATLKVPYFNPETYVCIGIIKYVNDSGSGFVIGTTNVDGTDCQITQVLGSIVPHTDTIDKN